MHLILVLIFDIRTWYFPWSDGLVQTWEMPVHHHRSQERKKGFYQLLDLLLKFFELLLGWFTTRSRLFCKIFCLFFLRFVQFHQLFLTCWHTVTSPTLHVDSIYVYPIRVRWLRDCIFLCSGSIRIDMHAGDPGLCIFWSHNCGHHSPSSEWWPTRIPAVRILVDDWGMETSGEKNHGSIVIYQQRSRLSESPLMIE